MKNIILIFSLLACSVHLFGQEDVKLKQKSAIFRYADNTEVGFYSIKDVKDITYKDLKEVSITGNWIPNNTGYVRETFDDTLLYHIFNSAPEIERIYIANTTFKRIPSIGKSKLKELSLNYNEISSLPNSIANLDSLEMLDLAGNYIEHLPDSFACLKNLKKFEADENKFTSFPLPLFQLPKLEYLIIGSPGICELPDSFFRLPLLKLVYITLSRIHALPASFSSLSQLEELDLVYTKFTLFPPEIKHLPKLYKVVLSGNPLNPKMFSESVKGISWRGMLVLDDTKLTPSQYKEIQKALPKMDVYY